METNHLIEQLYACSAECMSCYNDCRQEGDNEMLDRCMRLDQECADTCEFTASLLQKSSPNANKFIQLCAEICDLCAEECMKHDMDHCRRCADACKNCALRCRESLQGITV